MATRVIHCGWEVLALDIEPIASTRSIGTASIDTSITRDSLGSLKIDVAGGFGVNYDEFWRGDTEPNYDVGISFHFYCSSHTTPAGSSEIFRVLDASSQAVCSIAWANSGDTLCLLNRSGSVVGSTTAINLNEWYALSLEFTYDSAGSTARFLVNDLEITSGTVGGSTGANTAERFYIGAVDSQTAVMYFDNLKINYGVGSDEALLPNTAEIIAALFPTGDGGSNLFGADEERWKKQDGSAGDANNWQLVADNPPTTSTYLRHTQNYITIDVFEVDAASSIIPDGATFNCVLGGMLIGATTNIHGDRDGALRWNTGDGDIYTTDWSINGWATNDQIQEFASRRQYTANYRIAYNSFTSSSGGVVGVHTSSSGELRCAGVWLNVGFFLPSTYDPHLSLGYYGT